MQKERDKRRLVAMDAIIEKTDFKIPKLLIESELSKMVNELGTNISQMGLTIDSYLKHIGKNIEDLKKEKVLFGAEVKKAGAKWRKEVLAKGSTEDEMESLKKFLGRPPSDEAFLKEIGV